MGDTHHLIGHAAAAAFAIALVGTSAGTAEARGNDEVRATEHCSASSAITLKATSDDRRLEVELEVDSHRVCQAWSVSLSHDGSRFFHGMRRTAGPSGSFGVERHVANRSGRAPSVSPAGRGNRHRSADTSPVRCRD